MVSSGDDDDDGDGDDGDAYSWLKSHTVADCFEAELRKQEKDF